MRGHPVTSTDDTLTVNSALSRGRKFQGTKVPGSESSWNFRSWERMFQGAKVPGSESVTSTEQLRAYIAID